MSRLVGVEIVLPPLLGMLMVGILLKNIPYNFGQFGRAECTLDGHNATFVDSLHDLANPDHGSYKRSIPDTTTAPEVVNQTQSSAAPDCTPRYIGHDIDSEMATNLRMLCLVVLLLRSVPSLPWLSRLRRPLPPSYSNLTKWSADPRKHLFFECPLPSGLQAGRAGRHRIC
jgi:hypothetical protein